MPYPTVTLWVESDWCTDNRLNGSSVHLTEARATLAIESQAATHNEHGCQYEQSGPTPIALPAAELLDLVSRAVGGDDHTLVIPLAFTMPARLAGPRELRRFRITVSLDTLRDFAIVSKLDEPDRVACSAWYGAIELSEDLERPSA